MKELLIVTGSQKSADSLCSLLVPRFFQDAEIVQSAAKARREVSQQDYRFVLINAPLPDEAGETLALDIGKGGMVDVILLAAADWSSGKIDSGETSIFVLEKPVNRIIMEKTVQILQAAQIRSYKLMEENRKLTAKLEESRLVGRAKCALIAYRQMTEEQAHHYIERTAMDNRLPKKEVARDILRIYEE